MRHVHDRMVSPATVASPTCVFEVDTGRPHQPFEVRNVCGLMDQGEHDVTGAGHSDDPRC